MEPRTKALVSFIILVILLFGLYGFTNWFSLFTGYALGEDEKVKLAQCLDGKGVVLYVSSTCPVCENQLEVFGETAAEFINVFECESVDSCPAEGGVPAWEIEREFYYGFQELNKLVEISGCDID